MREAIKTEPVLTQTGTIRAIIVDDEPLAREELAFLLKPIEKARLGQSMERVRRLMDTPSHSAERLEELVRMLKEGPPQQAKLLLRSNGRLLLIDSSELIFSTIEDGLISMVTKEMEG